MSSFTPIQTVALGDPCPKCYAKTVLKINSKTNSHFVGCENFPDCNFTSPYTGIERTKKSSKTQSMFFARLTKDAPKNMSDEEKIIYCDALGRFHYNIDYNEEPSTDFIWECIDESIAEWKEIKVVVNVDKIYYALKKRLIPIKVDM